MIEADNGNAVTTVTDLTVAHAGLTELADIDTKPPRMNSVPEVEQTTGPEQSSVTAETVNVVAENSWDTQVSALANESGR
jgi:hypothetical protein